MSEDQFIEEYAKLMGCSTQQAVSVLMFHTSIVLEPAALSMRDKIEEDTARQKDELRGPQAMPGCPENSGY